SRLAVDEDGARTTAALVTAGLRARDVELLSERREERDERRALEVVLHAVDDEFHRSPPRLASALRTRTGSRRCRYHADESRSSCGWASSSTFSAASSGDTPPARACSTERARTAPGPAPLTATRTPSD